MPAEGAPRTNRLLVPGGFEGLFAVIALLAAVSALWIAGEGAGGTALLAAGTISLVVILRRRMQKVAAVLAAARAELERAETRDEDARRAQTALQGELARR